MSQALPLRDGLSHKTFGCIRRPHRSWHWGDVNLIDQPGSYGEEFTSFAGSPEVIGELLMSVVGLATHRAHQRLLEKKVVQTLGVGWWQGQHWDGLVVMGIRNVHQLCPMSEVALHNADLLGQLHPLTGVEQLMNGASDTFWELVGIGMRHPSHCDAAFDLAWRLAGVAEVARVAPGVLAWHRARCLSASLDTHQQSERSISRF